MTTPEAISQRDAAKRLGVSTATIERWVRRGQLNTIRTGKNGGARRVLIDDIFHAAANPTAKIHHADSIAGAKPITRKNPSPPTIDAFAHVDTTGEHGDELRDGLFSAAQLASDSRSASPDEKSLIDPSRESITHVRSESITPGIALEWTRIEDGGDNEPAQPEPLPVPMPAGATTAGPPLPNAPELPQQSARRPDDSELVPLKSVPSGIGDPVIEPRVVRHGRPSRRAALIALAAVAAGVGVAVRLGEQSPHRSGRPPAVDARDGSTHPQTVSKHRTSPPRSHRLTVPAARGGMAAIILVSATPASPVRRSTGKPLVSGSGGPAVMPVKQTSTKQSSKPITPCQSSGICVRPAAG